MAAFRHRVSFRLTGTFDAADLVASFRAAGWTVRRGRLQTHDGAILDTRSRSVLSAGLAALEERSGRRATLELWQLPLKPDCPERLLFSRNGASPNPRRLIAENTGLPLSDPLAARARYRREIIPFTFSSKAGVVTAKLDTLRPLPAASPLVALKLEVTRGTAATLSLASGLVRLHKGVKCELTSCARDLLARLRLHVGPRLEPLPSCGKHGRAGPAAVALLQANFNNMLAHEPGARVGLDIEFVHDMRVAIRRMRAALRMFSNAFIKEDRARLNADLRWLARVLGDVRDLDVYIEEIPAYLSCIHSDPGDYAFYLSELQSRRSAARRDLIHALDSVRYAGFLKRLRLFLSSPPLSDVRLTLRNVASAHLRRFSFAVFAPGRDIETEDDMHALRIDFKRLRYAVEFLRGLAPKRMGKLARVCARYQDVLGRFNDAVVACTRVRNAVHDKSRDKADSFLLGYLFACQRLSALDAKSRFFRRWRAKGAKRLSQGLKSALARL